MEFAVIPSFVLVGPLAVVAALFPGVFAKLAVQFRRWRALLTVASVNSTLGLVYYWVRGYLPDSPWYSPGAVNLVMLAVAATGLVWSGLRYRWMAATDPAATRPQTEREIIPFAGLTLAVGLLLGVTSYFVGRDSLTQMPWREFLTLFVGLGAATMYAWYRHLTRRLDGPNPPVWLGLSGESMALTVVLATTWFVATAATPSAPTLGDVEGSTTGGPKLDAVDVFRFDGADEVLSGVTVADGRLYFGTLTATGFRQSGAVWCADASTGKPVWTFTDDGGLKPVYATPAVADGRVYAGEGLHTDADRRMFALDTATGKPVWAKPTASHTEGGAWLAGGRIIFSAGDDGLYCVDAAGKDVWHVEGRSKKLHIDTPPVSAGRRVFAGSGYGTLALLAFDIHTGNELWRTPILLRSFSQPLVTADRVYYGVGTGNLIDDLSAEPGEAQETTPAGAVVCVEAATGKVAWAFDTPKSVHTGLATDGRCIFAACKDGTVYAVNRATGKLAWKRPVGEAFTAGPVVSGGAMYTVSQSGRAVCLDPRTGSVNWVRELSEATGTAVRVVSRPAAVAGDRGTVLYVGAGLIGRGNGAKQAAVFRLTDVAE